MKFSIAKRELLARTLETTGVNRLCVYAGAWNGLLVLNYHRIGDPTGSLFDWDLWSASEEDFDRQVAELSRNFDLVAADDLDDVLSRKSGRYVMISFDDGYRDNYESAFPILESHGATATFFLTTGFLDRPRVAWWDEIAWMVRSSTQRQIAINTWTLQPICFDDPDRRIAIRRLLRTYKLLSGEETELYLEFLAEATGSGRCPARRADGLWMTWEMVRQMRRAGMCFGGHSVSHPVLSSLRPEEQDSEVGQCAARIEAELGERPRTFSYPVGGPDAFDVITRACLEKHGYRWAFSYYGGYSRFDSVDNYNIPRVPVESDVSPPDFRALISLPQLFA